MSSYVESTIRWPVLSQNILAFTDWLGIQEEDGQANKGNHLAILLLAWVYILSALWVELPYGLEGPLPLGGIQCPDL
jgi:hypothetical protein